jgi:hypothetical protein
MLKSKEHVNPEIALWAHEERSGGVQRRDGGTRPPQTHLSSTVFSLRAREALSLAIREAS